MKFSAKLLGAILILGSANALPAQDPAPEAQSPALEPQIAAASQFDATQLDQLLGPIALYPDALVALILPASTASSDVVLAARYLRDGGDPEQAETQPWDPSVRALVRYPEVVKWMDENLAWTQQLGEAFVAQPTEVMNSVQRLRTKAKSVGTLTSTPQQQVVVDQSAISIVPTQPDVIYVPYYDPATVYVPHPLYYPDPFVYFGPAYAAGYWLSYNVDWHSHRVCYVNYHDRQRYWHSHPDFWRRPFPSNATPHAAVAFTTWAPRSSPAFAARQAARPPTQVFRPGAVNTVSNTSSRWRGYNDVRAVSNGPGNSVPAANALPQASFANSNRGRTRVNSRAEASQPSLANPLPQPVANPLPQPLANPLPQTLPAPLPHLQNQNAAPHTGSWARANGDQNNPGNGQRHSVPSTPATATVQSLAPRPSTAPSFAPRPAPAPSFAPRAAVTPPTYAPPPMPTHVQTATSYTHPQHFQAAPAPQAPAMAAPAPARAAPPAAPQYQAPQAAPAANSSSSSAPANAGYGSRGSYGGGGGYQIRSR